MQNQVQTNQAQGKQIQGVFGATQVYLNTERETLTHRFGADLRIEMPVNYYKAILEIPFEKKERSEEQTGNQRTVYGLIARPAIFLSKDGNYLIHSVLGLRISKHVNYYKKILTAQADEMAQATSEALPA